VPQTADHGSRPPAPSAATSPPAADAPRRAARRRADTPATVDPPPDAPAIPARIATPAPARPDDDASSERLAPNADAGTGALNLLAIPRADVFWRGQKIGRTPLFEHPMPAGRHSLELRPVDGGPATAVTIVVTAGQTTRRSLRLD
jgi:hypothetical protein